MKELISRLEPRKTAFFGQADSFTVIKQDLPAAELLRQLRMATLLYDHVIVAAAYFWQSRTVYSTLPLLEHFIRAADLLPSIRAPQVTRDVSDYFDKRAAETGGLAKAAQSWDPALASEVARPGQRRIALEVDAMGSFVYLDAGSVEGEFRALWADDSMNERDPFSVYNILLTSTGYVNTVHEATTFRAMSEAPAFSRSVVATMIETLRQPATVKAALVDRASTLYLLANARASSSDLVLTSRNMLYSRTYNANNLVGPLAFSNVDLFGRVLATCGIPPRMIDSISNVELLALKRSDEFSAFKDVYHQLVRSAMVEHANFSDLAWLKFVQYRRKEQVRTRVVRFLRKAEWVSGALFLAALGAVVQQPTAASQIILAGSSDEQYV